MNKRALCLAVAGAAIMALVPGAQASFPGENGKLVMLGEPLGGEDGSSDCLLADPHNIYTMDPDGSNIELLVDVDGYPHDPKWSPNGRRIILSIDEGEGGTGVYVMDGDGTALKKVIDEAADEGGPVWSPNGRRVAYTRGWRRRGGANIHTIRIDGTGRKQLTSHRAEDMMPAWSPDGRRIAFATTRGGDGLDIYTMNKRGSGMRRLTEGLTIAGTKKRPVYGGINSISWSPDGRWILYSFNAGSGSVDIYKMRRGGADKTHLGEGMRPVWSPDGKHILFIEGVQTRACTPKIKMMRPNGSDVRTVDTPNDIDLTGFDWQAR